MEKAIHIINILIISVLLFLLYIQDNQVDQSNRTLFLTEFYLTNIPKEDNGMMYFLQKAKEEPTKENLTDLMYFIKQYEHYLDSLITLKQDSINEDLYREYVMSINGWDTEYIQELANHDHLNQSDINNLNEMIALWSDFEKDKEQVIERGTIINGDQLTQLLLQLNNDLSQLVMTKK